MQQDNLNLESLKQFTTTTLIGDINSETSYSKFGIEVLKWLNVFQETV